MKNVTKTNLLCVFLCFCCGVGYSQIYDNSFNPAAESNRMAPTPNSPEAQAFTKYGETPVNLYTGSPNVQIPIYVFQGRELDLPISLTYDASGVKVEQLASSVGLSWNLNVGGRISRITNGFPDDFYGGANTNIPYKSFWDYEVSRDIAIYQNISGENPNFKNQSDLLKYMRFLKRVNENQYDTQPDYFSFNALGNSETFVIDIPTKKAKSLDNPRTDITFKKPIPGADSPIQSWVVTTEDGTKYTFAQAELTRDISLNDFGVSSLFGYKKEYNSSWLLTKIESPTSKDIYEFHYKDLGFWSSNRTAATYNGVTNVLKCGPNKTPSATNHAGYTGGNTYKIKQLVLNTVIHNGKRIAKMNSVARLDMDVDSAIEDIHIYHQDTNNHRNDLYQSFHFNYDYFRTPFTGKPTSSTDPLFIRLKLDEIEIKGKDENTENSYLFEYIDPYLLPSTTSKSQDYYGYYNGANNSVLYPKAPLGNCMPKNGANRDPEISYAKKGLLSKITYPTGGYTEFDYQPNHERDSSIGNIWIDVANVTATNGATLPALDTTICNSKFLLSPNRTPTIETGTFEVTSINKEHNLTWDYIGDLKRGYTVKHMATLVKIADENSTLTWSEVFDSNCNTLPGVEVIWTFDNIWNGDFKSLGGSTVLNLEQGHYQLLVANPFTDVTINVTAKKNKTIVNYTYQEKAGIRISEIKDYQSTNNLAKKRVFEYPSGQVISNPRYQYESTQYSLSNDNTTIIASDILHRVSYSSKTTKPHIGYASVVEKIQDFINPNNNIITKHNFNTAHYGNYRTGVYTYYIHGKETAKQYSVNYSLGKPSSTRDYDDQGNLVSKNSNAYYDLEYYSNTGVYLLSNESKSELYPFPKKAPNGFWYISYVPAKLIPAYAGGVLGAGMEGVAIMPPSECNIANFLTYQNIADLCTPAIGKLVKNNVSSYGKVGNKTLSNSVQYFDNQTYVSQTTSYSYYDQPMEVPSPISGKPDITIAPNYLLKEKSTSNNFGETFRQEFLYPNNCESGCGSLQSNNMVSIPIQTKVYKNNALLSNKKTIYSGIFPEKIQTAKGTQSLEDRLLFERDSNNNVVQVKQTDGTSTAYVWGHNHRYVVAKLENATYAQIQALTGFDWTSITGNLNIMQENALRGISGGMITTYTYDPLIGVTSITDPRRQTIYYHYDEFNRLKHVKDKEGNILSKNEYNYKN